MVFKKDHFQNYEAQASSVKKIFNFLFPIHKTEMRQFFTTAIMIFCILFVQNIARALKDSLITTLVATEVISVLKLWVVLPAAVLTSIIYVQMTKYMRGERVLYIILSFFVFFFIYFGFFIFPKFERSQKPKSNQSKSKSQKVKKSKSEKVKKVK